MELRPSLGSKGQNDIGSVSLEVNPCQTLARNWILMNHCNIFLVKLFEMSITVRVGDTRCVGAVWVATVGACSRLSSTVHATRVRVAPRLTRRM